MSSVKARVLISLEEFVIKVHCKTQGWRHEPQKVPITFPIKLLQYIEVIDCRLISSLVSLTLAKRRVVSYRKIRQPQKQILLSSKSPETF